MWARGMPRVALGLADLVRREFDAPGIGAEQVPQRKDILAGAATAIQEPARAQVATPGHEVHPLAQIERHRGIPAGDLNSLIGGGHGFT